MRLFFGIPLPQNVRDTVSACAAEAASKVRARYVPADNYHITLAFIGEVPPERMDDARRILRDTAAAFPPPVITLGEVGHFGKENNAIMIVHALARPALDPLHDALIAALCGAGLPHDPGPFSPHITLARHADMENVQLSAPPPLSFAAGEASLFVSARNAENVLTYTPVFHTPFGE